jgi:hypothetical protein
MHKFKGMGIVIILVLLFSLAGISFNVSASPLAAHSPTLGAAKSYSVLGAQTVTNTGPSVIPGNVGVSPGSAVTGFPPGIVGPPGVIHAADGNAANAQIAASSAFDFLDQKCTHDYTGQGVKDLTTVSPLGPGVYCADAFILTGDLTLFGDGVYIFKSASTLITSPNSTVTNGPPCDVWWRIASSATIDTRTDFIGTIIASTSISLNNRATVAGRAMALTGSVTMDTNTFTGDECLAQAARTATSKPKAKQTNVPSSEQTATALAGSSGLPGLPGAGGGAPIQDEAFPWSLVFVGGVSAMALVLGVRTFRRHYRPKE